MYKFEPMCKMGSRTGCKTGAFKTTGPNFKAEDLDVEEPVEKEEGVGGK